MQEIPQPELLDPDRLQLEDRGDLSDASRVTMLKAALRESCSYAQRLWQDLDQVRGYLLDSLPPDPRTAGPHRRSSAAPAGPDDDEGWERWIAAYSAVTSVLAGPHGDSGFGSDEARREARDRRVAVAPNPDAAEREGAAAEGVGSAAEGVGSASQLPSAARSSTHPGIGSTASKRSPLRIAARLAVVLLAVRGLRRAPG